MRIDEYRELNIEVTQAKPEMDIEMNVSRDYHQKLLNSFQRSAESIAEQTDIYVSSRAMRMQYYTQSS